MLSLVKFATVDDPGVSMQSFVMDGLLIGYARVSTNEQDLTAQQNALERLVLLVAFILGLLA